MTDNRQNPNWPGIDELNRGDTVEVSYISARTGSEKSATGTVGDVTPIQAGNTTAYSVRIDDHENERTIYVRTFASDVTSRTTRTVTLGELTSIEILDSVADDDGDDGDDELTHPKCSWCGDPVDPDGEDHLRVTRWEYNASGDGAVPTDETEAFFHDGICFTEARDYGWA